MKRIANSWILVNERANPSRPSQNFGAQPKVYFVDGTSRLLHEHSGETKEEAKAKAQLELDEFISQNTAVA